MTTTESGSALCTLSDFLQHEYDYIVVGGGTAGLCIAARLTENPDVKVGVLEAGSNRIDDPQVYTPSLYPTLIGREKYDWCFETVPQESANGKKYSMPRGKLLGGSSGINYLVSDMRSRCVTAGSTLMLDRCMCEEAVRIMMDGRAWATRAGAGTAWHLTSASINATIRMVMCTLTLNSCHMQRRRTTMVAMVLYTLASTITTRWVFLLS